MSATTIRYRGKVVNHDPMTNPENGCVEGFYYQDLDNGIVKHYIFNCPMIGRWTTSVRIIKHDDLPEYENPVTTTNDIKELQVKLTQTCIDFIKERNLTDIDMVRFNVDGLAGNAIEFGEWVSAMDSYIGVEGLQEDTYVGKSGDSYTFRVRKFIGEYM